MKLRPEQLDGHLAGRLAPIYLISGDEPLLLQEAGDAIRAAARAQGYGERVTFSVEPGFDWGELAQTAAGMSLFAAQRLIDLRMPGGKPGEAGARALAAYAERPVEGNLLLLSLPRTDKATQSAKWFAALERRGVLLQLWPPAPAQLPGWITQRMRARGMQPTPAAAAALAGRVEGNLLACVQEIEKMLLLRGPGAVDEADVLDAVADSARYDVFTLVDGVLAGDAARCARILRGLEGEGVEPVLVGWALTREIRLLATLSQGLAQGKKSFALYQQHRVWEKRQPLLEQALKRHDLARWRALLRFCARLDRVTKGQAAGNVWDELLQLCLLTAGVRIEALAQPAIQ
ncbi:MAG: DNA polymerase III subunit delta [Gammaproteobacteria bacterium]